MSADCVWIFDERPQGPAVGVWVSNNLLAQPDPAGILKMAVIGRQQAARVAGITAERHGFGTDVYEIVAAGRWRRVPNQRTEFAKEVVFGGGAFLMFGDAVAPNEVESPGTTFEVRDVLGAYKIFPLGPIVRKKSFFQKITRLFGGQAPATKAPAVQAYDLRSDDDRAIAQRARTDDSLGPEVEALMKELVEIGSREAFLTDGPNRENVRDPRTQEIGRLLAGRGQKPLMKTAYYRVEAQCGSRIAGHLSIAWDGIGGWMM